MTADGQLRSVAEEELGLRWRTALLGLPLLVLALGLGGYLLFILTFLAGWGILEETRRLVGRTGWQTPVLITTLAYAVLFWTLSWGDVLWIPVLGTALLAYAVGAWMVQVHEGRSATAAAWNAAMVVITILITALAFALIFRVRYDWGIWAIIWMLVVVWGSDAGAFFTGRALGGRKLAPRISPGKTLSGFFGGLAAAMFLSPLFGLVLAEPALELWHLVLLGAVGSVSGQLGDLAASYVKRKAAVKDSGQLLPGHGGLLDRFDSILLGVPVLWLLSVLFLGELAA